MLTWGQALEELKQGKRVARGEWAKRSPRQYLFMVAGSDLKRAIDKYLGPNTKKITDQVWISTSKNTLGPYGGCNCDTVAEDWEVI